MTFIPGCPISSCVRPNCENPTPPSVDKDGCTTGCPTCECPPLPVCTTQVLMCETTTPTDENGCITGCQVCVDDESTCELVEKCDTGNNKICHAVTPCGDKDEVLQFEYCEGIDCVYTEDYIPLMKCKSTDCAPVESVELSASPAPLDNPCCDMDREKCVHNPAMCIWDTDNGACGDVLGVGCDSPSPLPPREDTKSPSPPPPREAVSYTHLTLPTIYSV